MNDANANTRKSRAADPGLPPAVELTPGWTEPEPAALPAEDLTNRTVGEFRLLRLLGRGGMAEVYLADQTSLNRKVAIKILRTDLKANDVLLQRFEREARAAASLSHPNIVQVFVVGQEEGLHFIAQEYVQGLNLKEYIRRKGPPTAQLALHFMKQVAAAIDKAGSAGIVHRDIKPENILITQKGVVKVADFGLAQLIYPEREKSSVELTQVGTTMGTPLYMSPEQVHGQKLDQRSDLYSFGVTCFHLLAGEPPFHGETAMSLAIQHLNEKPPRLRDRRPDLPPALCQVVHKMMAKDPEKRYADAAAVLRDLKQIQSALKKDVDPQSVSLSGFDLEGDEDEPARSWPARFARWSTPRKLLAYAAVCVLMGLLAAGIGWWTQPVDPLSQPARALSHVPQRRTAAEQYDLALKSFASDEAAWLAVIDNFPRDREYRYRAQEQLGLLYLQTLQLQQADRVFNNLASESNEPSYQAKGLAGQAVVASLRGDDERVRQLDAQLRLHPDFDLRSLLGQYVEDARRRLPPITQTGLLNK